jgi:glutamine synthetase
MITQDRLTQWLADHDIDEVEAVVSDIAGVARGKFMPAGKFVEQGGMRLPESVFIQTVTGEYVEEPVISPTDRDMLAVPDFDTLRVVPWASDPTACVIHDCLYQDGSTVDIYPRQILKNILALYAEKGMKPVVAPEVEFYIVKRNTDPDYPLEPPVGRSGRQQTVRQPYSMDAIDEFEPLIEDIYDYCDAQQLRVDNLVHETGTAQLEINFEHGDALDLADQIFLFKRTVRETAMRHDVYATFMAKPMQEEPGSSMHWHMSVVDSETGANKFAGTSEQETEALLGFIAGLQRYLPEINLLCAPYVNSYRRFTRYLSAPINLQWGYDNRTVGLRVPESRPENRRIENRLAGADANPYLAIAASLACGYLGMEQGLKPSAPESGSAYRLPFALPRNLYDALSRLESSENLAQIIGQRFITVYTAIKQHEYQRYFQVISPWEREYLLLSV